MIKKSQTYHTTTNTTTLMIKMTITRKITNAINLKINYYSFKIFLSFLIAFNFLADSFITAIYHSQCNPIVLFIVLTLAINNESIVKKRI